MRSASIRATASRLARSARLRSTSAATPRPICSTRAADTCSAHTSNRRESGWRGRGITGRSRPKGGTTCRPAAGSCSRTACAWERSIRSATSSATFRSTSATSSAARPAFADGGGSKWGRPAGSACRSAATRCSKGRRKSALPLTGKFGAVVFADFGNVWSRAVGLQAGRPALRRGPRPPLSDADRPGARRLRLPAESDPESARQRRARAPALARSLQHRPGFLNELPNSNSRLPRRLVDVDRQAVAAGRRSRLHPDCGRRLDGRHRHPDDLVQGMAARLHRQAGRRLRQRPPVDRPARRQPLLRRRPRRRRRHHERPDGRRHQGRRPRLQRLHHPQRGRRPRRHPPHTTGVPAGKGRGRLEHPQVDQGAHARP